MIILNILGRIEKTYISEKLGLYISNLPDGGETNWNNWQEGIKNTISIAYETEKIEANQFIGKYDNGPENRFVLRVIEKENDILDLKDAPEDVIIKKYIDYLSRNMICIGIDYEHSSIPDGDNTFSCFDGGSCEEEPVEKLLDFLNFISGGNDNNVSIPYCIYSTSVRKDREYSYLFSGTTEIKDQVLDLKKLGQQLDNFLVSEKEFYQLDYLCNALFDIDMDERNTYHYMKLYSLCALFLEKKKEQELDYKLPCFMDLSISSSEREGMAELMRRIRNKIAHGDFEKINPLLEEYAQKYMDGRFLFDYSEYTRPSWVLLHISCSLEKILRSLMNLMLTDNEKLVAVINRKNHHSSENGD